jgi:hypothetical protein
VLKSLRIHNFRAFGSLSAEGLTPVTLFVGTNNAGKTSVLEAAEILLLGSGRGLLRGPLRRDEFVYPPGGGGDDRPRYVVPNHLFHGHAMGVRSIFRIDGENDGPRFVECRVVSRNKASDEMSQEVLPLDVEQFDESLPLALSITADRDRRSQISLTSTGGITPEQYRLRVSAPETEKTPPVFFLGAAADFDLGMYWDRVVLTPEEEHVVAALRIIEPGIERIAPIRQARYPGASVFVVKLRSSDERLPLGSMGDGMRHLLALAISLASAAGGCLLVDEIDTGLHYSVMKNMWHLIVESAIRLQVQVLATTHSRDCVEALACLFGDEPALQESISLHRIERGRACTVRYSAEELLAASQQRMDVR